MSQVAELCDLDALLLRAFSDRTVQGLERHRSARLMLPLLEKLMRANVDKELAKDKMVIEAACGACDRGGSVDRIDVDTLFERTRAVDRHFVQKLSGMPVKLELDYTLLRPIRVRRIAHLLDFACDVFRHWQSDGGLAQTLRAAYRPEDLHVVLHELLRLYSLETRLVVEAAKLRGPLRVASSAVSERVAGALADAGEDVARSVGARFYEGAG